MKFSQFSELQGNVSGPGPGLHTQAASASVQPAVHSVAERERQLRVRTTAALGEGGIILQLLGRY